MYLSVYFSSTCLKFALSSCISICVFPSFDPITPQVLTRKSSSFFFSEWRIVWDRCFVPRVLIERYGGEIGGRDTMGKHILDWARVSFHEHKQQFLTNTEIVHFWGGSGLVLVASCGVYRCCFISKCWVSLMTKFHVSRWCRKMSPQTSHLVTFRDIFVGWNTTCVFLYYPPRTRINVVNRNATNSRNRNTCSRLIPPPSPPTACSRGNISRVGGQENCAGPLARLLGATPPVLKEARKRFRASTVFEENAALKRRWTLTNYFMSPSSARAVPWLRRLHQ